MVIDDGQLVLVTGPTGAGKSTLLRALLALDPDATGRWWWQDQELADPADELRLPRVGYLPSEPELFNVTIRENVVLGRDVDDDTLRLVLHVADLDEVHSWPDGLDTVVATDGSRLSGGQRQRVALARVLAGGPALLVLDGPTSSLDAATAERVWQRLRERVGAPGSPLRAILATTERADAVGDVDRRYELADGTVCTGGTARR
jgi:ABC-type transport system involved in cytochrome bd biosynthesis fused ATPase/permease subunit